MARVAGPGHTVSRSKKVLISVGRSQRLSDRPYRSIGIGIESDI